MTIDELAGSAACISWSGSKPFEQVGLSHADFAENDERFGPLTRASLRQFGPAVLRFVPKCSLDDFVRHRAR